MADKLLAAPQIVEHLISAHRRHTSRLKNKCLFLSRSAFNQAAGRAKVEDKLYAAIARSLRRAGLHLLRFEDRYALIADETLLAWPAPDAKDRQVWSRAKKQAAKGVVPHAKTALSPAAAWPYPAPKAKR